MDFPGILDLCKSYTDLEVLDAATKFLLTQKQTSCSPTETSMCKYRGLNGLKCAVGAFIPDQYYTPSLENVTFEHLCTNDLIDPDSVLGKFFNKHRNILIQLQTVHDLYPPKVWESKLAELRQRWINKDQPQVSVQE